MQLKALSHFASVAAAAIVGVVLERIRARRSYALIERAPGFKAWRMSKWVKHAGRIETQGLVGTDAASSIADQTAQALAKLDAILTEAGSSRDKLLSVTIYLRDIESATPRLPFNVSMHRVDEVSLITTQARLRGHEWRVRFLAWNRQADARLRAGQARPLLARRDPRPGGRIG